MPYSEHHQVQFRAEAFNLLNIVNEARFGYSRFYNSLGAIAQGSENIVQELNLPNLLPGPPVTWGIPSVGFNGDGFSGFGDNSDGPNRPNWGGPNGNILAGAPIPGQPANAAHAGFGTINSLATGIPMRQLQLGLQ
jgi:hypothetical protein